MFLGKILPTVKKVTETVIDWLSVVLLSGIFILGLAQVIWRWILNNPIVWSEELIQLTYVWICLVSFRYCKLVSSDSKSVSWASRTISSMPWGTSTGPRDTV